MVKMPKHYKEVPKDEAPKTLVEKLVLAKTHLKRFCFLGSFEPVYIYKRSLDVREFYKKLNEVCECVEPQLMLHLLTTAYNSVLPRRDEVAALFATYLLGDVPLEWKVTLRGYFPTLVKTDGDLFMFCKYAALIHKMKKQAIFCKTVKKAIAAWYKKQTSEDLAHMFATNRGMHGFTHRALIKLCRISDVMLGTKYLYQSFNSSCQTLVKNADNPLPSLPEPKASTAKKEDVKVEIKTETENKNNIEPSASSSNNANALETSVDQEKIRSIVVGVSALRTTTDAKEALSLVQQLNLKYENLPYHLLQYPEVLKTVAKSISCEQLLKCLHSEKIRKHFAKQDVLKVCRERFQKRGGMKNEHVDPIMFLMSMDRLSIANPLKPTNNKNTSRGRLVQFSKQLYRLSFWETEPTNLRVHITINMQQSYMKKILKNTKTVSYQFAAVALAFSFFKAEGICDVHRWTETTNQLSPLNWNKKMDFLAAFESCSYVQNMKNNQRLYVPIMQVSEKARVYDLFIAIVPAGTRGNKKNSSETLAEALEKYRTRQKVNAKYVIVDLLRYKKSMKYSLTKCENILEICGLDENTMSLIYNFALKKFD